MTTAFADLVVYDNIPYLLNLDFKSTDEFGDEVTLAGTNRTITSFAFEYYGDFVANGDETARIRFYKMDGDVIWVQANGVPVLGPGTQIYDSGFIPIASGYGTRTINALSTVVPDTFTYTVQFSGVTGATNDSAGLLVANPPILGSSFNDFWVKKPSGWGLQRLDGTQSNFAARLVAFSVSVSSQINLFQLVDGNAEIQASAVSGGRYVLEYKDNLSAGTWTRVGKEKIATANFINLEDASANSSAMRFYRVVSL